MEHLSQFVVIDQRIRFKVSVTSGVYAGDSVFPDAVWWRYPCRTSVTVRRHRSANQIQGKCTNLYALNLNFNLIG